MAVEGEAVGTTDYQIRWSSFRRSGANVFDQFCHSRSTEFLVTRPLPHGPLSIVCGNAFSTGSPRIGRRTSGNSTCAKVFTPGRIGSHRHLARLFFYLIRNLASVFVSALLPRLHELFTSSHPSLSLPPSHSNAPPHEDRRRPWCLLRWRVQHMPRVPRSLGLHHLSPHTGHRAVHQLVEKLPEDWRVVVIERNTYCYSPSTSVLRTNLNALDTSVVSGITFKSLAVLLLIPASDLIVRYHRLVHTTASRCAAGP